MRVYAPGTPGRAAPFLDAEANAEKERQIRDTACGRPVTDLRGTTAGVAGLARRHKGFTTMIGTLLERDRAAVGVVSRSCEHSLRHEFASHTRARRRFDFDGKPYGFRGARRNDP